MFVQNIANNLYQFKQMINRWRSYMNNWILITIFLGIIAVTIEIIVFFTLKKQKKEGTYRDLDYRAFFILGISFLPMGIIFTTTISPAFIGFIGIGVCYMAIGLANRDKWVKKGGIKMQSPIFRLCTLIHANTCFAH